MSLSEAQAIAHKIMDTRGIREMGWTFGFDNSVRRFGCTHYDTKSITISRKLTELNEADVVEQTILHEIAHVIAGHSAGHGYQWQNVASILGYKGERCYSSATVVTPPTKWVGTCPNCNRSTDRHRKSKGLACGKCCDKYNNGNWSSNYIFSWKERW